MAGLVSTALCTSCEHSCNHGAVVPANVTIGGVLLTKSLHADLVKNGLALGIVLVVHDPEIAHPASILNAVDDTGLAHIPFSDLRIKDLIPR